MHGGLGRGSGAQLTGGWAVVVLSREELANLPRWRDSFATERKDHRFYELVEDTIRQGFDYGYFAIKNERGEVGAIQPFFIVDQDLLAGTHRYIQAAVDAARHMWPGFLRMRTLMVGCSVGEGHLDGAEPTHLATAELLAASITRLARELKTPLIVLKEFPAKYRDSLQCFLSNGFTRVPSLPMTRLNIDYGNFDDYLNRAISPRTRGKLRRKFRATARAAPTLEMSLVDDLTPVVEEVYPLYMQVYERSALHFEKLTKEYLCALGQRMPDKTRFFLWRQRARTIAFSICMVQENGIYSEYIGLDYSVAFDLNLYYVVFRDTVEWAIANGYKWFRSSSLNYDPKFHLRQSLDPIDLYVKHTSRVVNAVLSRILPWIEPTRYDKTLPKFDNYKDLWAEKR
jgi:hypothetical protein